jgi:hypothetical protein
MATTTGLQAFLQTAGRSLADAQSELTGSNLQTDLVIANAELEAKVTLKTDSAGKLSVEPMSSEDIQQASLNAAGISTLRVSFVATAGETPPGTPAIKPTRKPTDVIDSVRTRPDVIALERIVGTLKVETVFVPETKRWVVTARDPKGRVVRETLVPDVTT